MANVRTNPATWCQSSPGIAAHSSTDTSNSHNGDSRSCPYNSYHIEDSTAARLVVASVLDILSTQNINSRYASPQGCPMVECFEQMPTPLAMIQHLAACPKASKGEVRCWTCKERHKLKRGTPLGSPVQFLRRLSKNRKHIRTPSPGVAPPGKRGKVGDDDKTLDSELFESIQETEDPHNSLWYLHEAPPSEQLGELEALPSKLVSQQPSPPTLSTSTSSRTWSNGSHNSITYGHESNGQHAGQPPAYFISPDSTVDEVQPSIEENVNLRLAIPSVSYISGSHLTASPDDMEPLEDNRVTWDDGTLLEQTDVLDLPSHIPRVPFTQNSAFLWNQLTFPNFAATNPHDYVDRTDPQTQWTWPMRNPVRNHPPRTGSSMGLDFLNSDLPDPRPTSEEAQPPVPNISELPGDKPRAHLMTKPSHEAGVQDCITVAAKYSGKTKMYNKQDTNPGNGKTAPTEDDDDKCPVCGRVLGGLQKNRKAHLKRHIETVHGESRHHCDRCDGEFNRLDNLRAHQKKAHQDDPGSDAAMKMMLGNDSGGPGTRISQAVLLGTARRPRTRGKGKPKAYQEEYQKKIFISGENWDATTAVMSEDRQSSVGKSQAAVVGIVTNPAEQCLDVESQHMERRDQKSIAFTSSKDWATMTAGIFGDRESELGNFHGTDIVEHAGETGEDSLRMSGSGIVPRPLDLPGASWRVEF